MMRLTVLGSAVLLVIGGVVRLAPSILLEPESTFEVHAPSHTSVDLSNLPIFYTGRAEDHAPEPIETLPSTATEDPVLLGIVRSDGTSQAMIAASTGEIRAYAAGDTIDGWEIVDIALRTVELQRDDQVLVLELFEGQE